MVLERRNLLIFGLSQFLGNAGWWLSSLALQGFVLYYKQFDGVDYGLMVFFNVLPIFLFGYLAGKISDLLDKKKLLIILDIARGIVVLCIPFSTGIYMVWMLVFLNTALFTMYRAAMFGLLKEVFYEQQLLQVNSIMSISRSVGMIAGPTLLSVLLIKGNWNIPFFLDAATYFISALALLSLRRVRAPISVKDQESYKNFKAIYATIRDTEILKKLFLITFGYSLISGAFNTVWYLYIKDSLHLSANYIGVLQLFIGGGSILGSFVISRIKKTEGWLVVSVFIYGFMVLGISLFNEFAITAAGALIIGFSFAIFTVLSGIAMQKESPEEAIGRISNLHNTIQLGFELGWSSVIGFVLIVLSPEHIFQVVSVLMIIYMTILVIMLKGKDSLKQQSENNYQG